jgi:hypothetical protein
MICAFAAMLSGAQPRFPGRSTAFSAAIFRRIASLSADIFRQRSHTFSVTSSTSAAASFLLRLLPAQPRLDARAWMLWH